MTPYEPASGWPCAVVLLLSGLLLAGALALAWWLGAQHGAPSPSCIGEIAEEELCCIDICV